MTVVPMGTSLGGFWARRLGHELGKHWIALNPAIQPSQSLRRYVGPNTRFDTGGAFDWCAADCGRYVAEERSTPRGDLPGLFILAEDDEGSTTGWPGMRRARRGWFCPAGASIAQYRGLWRGGLHPSRGGSGLACTCAPENPLANPGEAPHQPPVIEDSHHWPLPQR